VDAWLTEGITSSDSQALRDTLRRIKELKDELAMVTVASEI
jgi:hypothetical protein